jgi:tetrahydromethanopterin S-methyltransferase subunit C
MIAHILQHHCKFLIFVNHPFMKLKLNWDALGIATSILCAIHCALLPVVVSTLPVFGIDIVENAVFEWGMIALAFVVGVYSLYHGFIKHHRNYLPVYIFGTGFLFLVIKQFFKQYEYVFLTIAVLLIIAAHYYNYRLCHKSKCASPHHSH